MRLTKNAVVALATDKPDHVFWDDALPGFGCRLRGVSKSWIIQYRIGAQQRRESLGDVRKVALEDARRVARQRFAEIELGHDPAAAKAKIRAAAAMAKLTLGSVADRYLDVKRDVLRAYSHRTIARYFAVHWLPLRDRPLDTIRRADVAARLQEIVKAHGRVAAARARAHLSALFNWAMREGLCESNPVAITNDPGAGLRPRERVLTDQELKVIWAACEDDDFGNIVKLLILTGARRQEIGSLKWDEIDFDTGVMTIPGSRTKNARALALTLPAVALDILRSTPRRRDFVFATRGAGFTSWSTSMAALRRRLSVPLASFSLHDLRRTFRTGIGKLGVPPHIAELAIGHVKAGIVAVYDKHRYEGEVAAALAQWAEHVTAIVEGRKSKVTPLRRA
jgi:integrase